MHILYSHLATVSRRLFSCYLGKTCVCSCFFAHAILRRCWIKDADVRVMSYGDRRHTTKSDRAAVKPLLGGSTTNLASPAS